MSTLVDPWTAERKELLDNLNTPISLPSLISGSKLKPPEVRHWNPGPTLSVASLPFTHRSRCILAAGAIYDHSHYLISASNREGSIARADFAKGLAQIIFRPDFFSVDRNDDISGVKSALCGWSVAFHFGNDRTRR